MRITANYGTAPRPAFCARRSVYQKSDAAPAVGTSLMVCSPDTASSPQATMSARPHAALLAQLIAKAQDLPVSRERRRADPLEGASVYRAAADLGRANERKNLRLI